MAKYTLSEKYNALCLMDTQPIDLVSLRTEVPVSTLQVWRRNQQRIRRNHAEDSIIKARQAMADKILRLVSELDDERIAKAPLNQLSAALGVLVDRYLKLESEDSLPEQEERAIRIEYVYPDGQIHDTPPLAAADLAFFSALQSGRLRETLRQDNPGTDGSTDTGGQRTENLVAGADVSDSERCMAEDKARREIYARYID
ncbi:MAG: hypothetical protein ACPG7F_07415 [Aggregatilineales bacterium]